MQTEVEEASLLAPDSDEIQSGVVTALFKMAKTWRRQYKDDRPTLGEYSREVVKQLGVWVNDGVGQRFEESGIYAAMCSPSATTPSARPAPRASGARRTWLCLSATRDPARLDPWGRPSGSREGSAEIVRHAA